MIRYLFIWCVNSINLHNCIQPPFYNCKSNWATHAKSPTKPDIRTMLHEINYALPDANLGKIVRKNLRKEWIYFFESFIKVFSGKISNFDAITYVIQ